MFGLSLDLLFGKRGFQIPRASRMRRNSTRINTNNAVRYPGFCAGKQEAERRKRQIADGRLRPNEAA